MEIIFESLIETGWGVIILGIILISTLIIEFFKNKPRI